MNGHNSDGSLMHLMQPMDSGTSAPVGNSSGSGPPAKRRRKNDGEPSEPRRLRRSHEACTRCRGKKIKCDSKHPRCTACVTAGVQCNQEDRHRQTTIARDHTERLEQVVAQCDALLKRHIPGFSLQTIDDVCTREGIDIEALQPVQSLPPQSSSAPPMSPVPQPGFFPYYQYPQPPYIYPTPFAVPAPAAPQLDIPGQDPKANDMSSTTALAKSFGVAASIVNETASPITVYYHAPPAVTPPLAEEDLAVGSSGLDSGRDRVLQLEMPAPRDTAKWRSVSVFRSQPYSPADIWIPTDRKTLVDIVDIYFTRLNPHRPVFFRHQFIEALNQLYDDGARPVFDPGFICSLYLVLALGTLSELNRSEYQGDGPRSNGDVGMDGDANDQTKASPTAESRLSPDWPAHDEFFDRALAVKPELRVTLSSLQALILLHWYLYAERQGRTLWRLVGSIVRLAIELGLHHDPLTQTMPNPAAPTSPSNSDGDGSSSSVPAEIPTFSALECILRIRLWSIVLVHDRGTSILLGRPLAISPSDANTTRPSKARSGDAVFTVSPNSGTKPPTMADLDISEHFLLSAPIADIQADIIISLYSPTRQSGETLLRNASRIIRSINLFRRSLPPSYKHYFTGTASWPLSLRHSLLSTLTESTGLTLLKLAISRILLLRALFSSKELGYAERRKALVDAIIQAHNVIAIHTVLVRFPEVGFFTSPVPLHIAAMVILYGRMSNCDVGIPGLLLDGGEGGGDREDAASNAVRILMEDVWLALDMLPRFRWRWETGNGSSGGTNPLIAKLAEKVMAASFSEEGLRGIGPPDDSDNRSLTAATESESEESRLITGIGRQGPVGQPVLIPEPDWEEELAGPTRDKSAPSNTPIASNGPWGESNTWGGESTTSPKSQQTTPTLQAAYPPSYPPACNTSSAGSFPYPPPASAPNAVPNTYPHAQYPVFNPPVFGPQPVNGTAEKSTSSSSKPASVSSASNGVPPSSTPVRTPTRTNGMPSSAPNPASTLSSMPQHMVEVPQSLFYPFYPDISTTEGVTLTPSPSHAVGPNTLHSPPQPQHRSTRAASSAPGASGSSGTASSLLAAVATQVRGGQQGAPDMYMSEERVTHFVNHGPYLHTPPGSYSHSSPATPSAPPGSHSQPESSPHPPQLVHHPPSGGLYHIVNGGHTHGNMHPPQVVWASHGHTSPPRPSGYTAQSSS
ncbi:hypothetical protein BDP27DRAFT_1329223 [Rhodocollybia butyracea]|uniref:Zn(2)-C6 fungal-type domain-containing protein n=1 Tax=Rhodocollybia butyracea TaxID=206335 RepID=A0A9P5PPX4_9AGAR|nr:hypothetical protein BDP27DRAFT_1329223 [Rhodocollybia butyracea]